MKYTKKIDTIKALKARLAGGTIQSIATAQGVSKSTVSEALKPLMDMIPNSNKLKEYQSRQADILDAVSAGIVASICEDDFKKATLQQKATSIGIMTDKARLVRGQSTQNSISILLARHVKVHEVQAMPEGHPITVIKDEI